MKTTTKLRLFSLSGKHLYSKQDAILVFNPQAHRVLKLFYLQTNKKQSFLNAQEQQQKKKLIHIWKICCRPLNLEAIISHIKRLISLFPSLYKQSTKVSKVKRMEAHLNCEYNKNLHNYERYEMPRSNLAAKRSIYVHVNVMQCTKNAD